MQPTFTAPASPTTLIFQLIVNDGQFNSLPANVTITVVPLPVANAGSDQTVTVSTPVTLDGSGSADSNGNPLTYSWTQTGGTTTVTLSSTTDKQPTFTAPASDDSLIFQLVVNDGQASSPSATVTITVTGNP